MTTRTPINISGRLALLALCLACGGLWIHGLARPALTGDEAYTALMARATPAAVLARLNSDEPHPPVFYLSMAAWGRLFPQEHELLWRLPSVFLGLLALSLTFRLGRALGLGTGGAVAAAALLALNPQVTVHVREARMYPAMLATVALAALAAVRAGRGRGPVWAAALAGGLALFTHYFNAPFVAALSLWGALVLRGPARRRWLGGYGLAWVALGLWLALGGHGFLNPTSLSTGKTWSFLLPPWETLARLAAVGAAGYRGYAETWLTFLTAPLLAAGWLAGVWLSRRRTGGLLLLMAAGPLAAYALLAAVRPIFHPKYVLPWLIFAALGAGEAVTRGRRLGALLGLTLAAGLLVPTWDTVRRPYEAALAVPSGDQLTSLPRDLGRALLGAAGPTDLFGLTTPDVAHCYYAERYFSRNLGCALLPAYPGQPAAELAGQVDTLLADHRLLWLLNYPNPAWDPGGAVPAALKARTVDLGPVDLAGRTLTLYSALATIRREQTPVAVRLGDFAELTGVWVAPAEGLRLVLVWRATADQPAVDAKVFVHLTDPAGVVLAQDDSVPVGWTRPFNTWRLGEELLDVHVLGLPAGVDLTTASLHIGAYDPNTLERVPLEQDGARPADGFATLPYPAAP